MQTVGRRYAKHAKGRESGLSRNVREMINMIKKEKVSNKPINFNKLNMSKHATERAIEYFGCSEEDSLEVVKNILEKAVRVGEQLAYDGRINVMYSYNQYAVYLSPNLRHVVTIHKFQKVSYEPVCQMLSELRQKFSGEQLRKELIKLHRNAWNSLEKKEVKQQKLVMEMERELSKYLKQLRKGYSPKFLTSRIDELRTNLFLEGKKLFNIKLEKRHIGKSITSLLETDAEINS